MSKRPNPSENLLRALPTKWAVALVVVLIVYVLAQPWLNRQFGWNLPSLNPTAEHAQVDHAQADDALGKDSGKRSVEPTLPKEDPIPTAEKRDRGQQASETRSSDTGANESSPSGPKVDSGSKKYGLLTDLGRKRYQSPAGLIYGPGSEEGHRLQHLERHLADQPNRPGKHGVFDGDMAAAIRWIDDAYQRSMRNAKGTSQRQEAGRTVIEANFDKPIGYIGGRDGKRASNPPARRLRLIVEDQEVITAFPF